jgi:hypothetical protein
MKTALPALLAAASLAALASYPVDVEPAMNGLAVEVLASSGSPLVITFRSEDKRDARCTAEVASGLDTPQERTVTVKAGRSTAIPFKLRSAPNRVRVKATCTPAALRSDAKP